MKIEETRKILKLCKPLLTYLKENYDPHSTLIISEDYIRIVRDEVGLPTYLLELDKARAKSSIQENTSFYIHN